MGFFASGLFIFYLINSYIIEYEYVNLVFEL